MQPGTVKPRKQQIGLLPRHGLSVRKLQVATELKSREVGAEEMAARQRGEARVELTPYQRSQILKDVTKEVDDNTGH
jgi:hypothetical protein